MSECIDKSDNKIRANNSNNLEEIIETVITKKKQLQTVKETFLEWSSRNDTNSYRKIFDYKENILAQILWLLIFLVLISLTVLLIQMNIRDYLTYAVVTTYEVIYESPTEFPTLTICASSPFLSNQAIDLLQESAFNNSLDILSNLTDVIKLAKMFAANPEYGDENRKLLGLSIDNIVSCQFNNKDCKEDLHWIWLFDYGNCFQFNAGRNYLNRNIDLAKSSRTEPSYGLNLVIDFYFMNNIWVNNNQMIHIQTYDFVALVHNSSNRISSSTSFIFLDSFKKRSILSVERTFIYKQAWPYSDCIDMSSYSSDYYNFLLHSNYSYRQLDCLDLCIQQEIMNECKCYDLRYPKLNNQTKPCLNLTEYNCAEIEINNFDSSACIRDSCPLECNSQKFVLESSTGNPYSKPFQVDTLNPQYLSVLNVFYRNLEYTVVAESPQTTFIELLTELGGSMGMFISFSVFTLFETIEICILIIYKVFHA